MLLDLSNSIHVDTQAHPDQFAVKYNAIKSTGCGIFPVECGSHKPKPLTVQFSALKSQALGLYEVTATIKDPFRTNTRDFYHYCVTTMVSHGVLFYRPTSYSIRFQEYSNDRGWKIVVSIDTNIIFSMT